MNEFYEGNEEIDMNEEKIKKLEMENEILKEKLKIYRQVLKGLRLEILVD